MMKRYSFRHKAVAFALAILFLFGVIPVSVFSNGAAEGIKSLASDTEEAKPPTSLDAVKIPTVTENPYDVDVFVDSYPIFNNSIYERLFFSEYINGYRNIMKIASEKSFGFSEAIFAFILLPKNAYRYRIPPGSVSTLFPLAGMSRQRLRRRRCPHSSRWR